MDRQQLHIVKPVASTLNPCCDCILHLDHHVLGDDCLKEVFKVAEEFHRSVLPEAMTFEEFYEAMYEEQLLIVTLGEHERK